MRSRLAVFISIVQAILFAGHLFIYATAAMFWGGWAASTLMKVALAVLSISFVTASLLGWYFHNPLARLYYVIAAVWLGLSSFLLCASVACWLVLGFARVARLGWSAASIADVLFGAAILAAIYGMVNAAWLRVSRVTVQLPNLPPQWRGRTAAMVSDTHLGHVRNGRFIRRVVRKLTALEPDVVFLAGDVYDGTAADFEKLARPWEAFVSQMNTHHGDTEARRNSTSHHGDTETRRTAEKRREGLAQSGGQDIFQSSSSGSSTAVLEEDPFLGVYYILGNHEEFYSHAEYLPPMTRAGVRLLNNEKVELDGVQLVGIHYRDAIEEQSYRQVLQSMRIDRHRPSILLLHAPVRLQIAEEEGISLQLSGHTHGGQFFPGTVIAKRVWGKFIQGLQRLGNLQVLISYGAGTWGPPMRVGTRPEIVVLNFE